MAKTKQSADLSHLSEAERKLGEATVLQIIRVADLLTRIGDSKVFDKDLTQAQFNVLMVLARHGEGGMSQKGILAKLVSSKGNVSIHIRNLTELKYVKTKTSPSDSRMHEITLTAKGRRVLAEVEPRYVRHLREVTGDLSSDEARAALQLLDHLQQKCRATLNPSDTVEGKGSAS